MIAKSKENAKGRIRALFESLDQALAGRDWIAGHRSVADAYLYVMTRWTDGVKIDVSDLDNLQRFRRHMEADAAVQKALKAEGLL